MTSALALLLFIVQEASFLSGKEAADAVVDESIEPYFSLLQPLEMVAKTGAPLTATTLDAQRDECRRRYRDAVREFSNDEKAALGDAAARLQALLKEAYPLFAKSPFRFIKLAPSIEGGMPHTRGASIVVSERMAAQAAALRKRGVDLSRSGFGQTLLHEQCHVVERARPALFADLYVNVWGLVRAKGLPDTPWLRKQQIVNPDGPDVGWVFPAKDGRFWQPLVMIKEGVALPKMPRDFVLVGVALDKKGEGFLPRSAADGRAETKPLDEIPDWQAAFGHVPENFHPNETFAVLFSWLALKDVAGTGIEKHPDVEFTRLEAWCRKNFAATKE